MYADRYGAIAKPSRHTGGGTQVTSDLFAHTSEVQANIFVHAIIKGAREAALTLDFALSHHRETQLRDKHA